MPRQLPPAPFGVPSPFGLYTGEGYESPAAVNIGAGEQGGPQFTTADTLNLQERMYEGLPGWLRSRADDLRGLASAFPPRPYHTRSGPRQFELNLELPANAADAVANWYSGAPRTQDMLSPAGGSLLSSLGIGALGLRDPSVLTGSVGGMVGREARPGQTVANPYRVLHEGIYGDPRKIVQEAASRVVPESPDLQAVFGVTRAQLDEMNLGGRRAGNIDPASYLREAPNPRGSESATNIMTPANEQRLLDILHEAGKIPGLRVGMDNWYTMDPAYQALVRFVGPDEAQRRWRHLNTMVGMASPGAEVTTEIPRGLLAHYLAEQGRFQDFMTHGGLAAPTPRTGTRPTMLDIGITGVPGHIYHSTSQAPPMQAYLNTGEMQMMSPKVPSYVHASGVPETGFQTSAAVPDAHWSRAVGLGDTRRGPTDIGSSASMPEMQMLRPWWRDRIAGQLGIEAVPAQARLWGAASGMTGVSSPIGSPKLEMLANHIAHRARQHGISVEEATRQILTGQLYSTTGMPFPMSLIPQQQPQQ